MLMPSSVHRNRGFLFRFEEAFILSELRKQIEWIQRKSMKMRSLLEDADAKQKEDEEIRNWVARVREISYDAEDVIDTFGGIDAQWSRQGFVGLFKRYSFIFTEHKIRRNVVEEIQRIKARINDIPSLSGINEGEGLETASTSQNVHDRMRNFAEILEDPDFVGLEDFRETLKDQLINGDSKRAVISIAGEGGSGKTTVARKVYFEVEKHFHYHAFIYASEHHEIKDILIQIITCVMRDVSREEMEKAEVEDLKKKLSEHLSLKRYLVVIDDIPIVKWGELKSALPDVSNKSRVMLTTHSNEGAERYGEIVPKDIRLLEEKESWELFLKKVFPQGSACPLELKVTGEKILAKCGGLPLAIVVLGGLLSRRDKTLSAWSKVLDSVTCLDAEGSDKWMEKLLALSYYDLPHYLKPCFLYLGLFPKAFEIKSSRLIKLWIAEGFIQQRRSKILEDVAEDYLEELIGRGMLQVASRRSNGLVRTCRIHDLLRDFTKSEAKQNNFFEIVGDDHESFSTREHRRLAFYHSTEDYKVINRSALCSMLCFNGCELDLSKLLGNGRKLLRVLDVEDVTARDSIPKEIGEFVHLRYLSFGRKFLKAHPACFTIPINLQTLKFKNEMVLPNAIWDLERLRHLHADYCEIEGEPRLQNLRNLQTLCLKRGGWIEFGLDRLTNLRKLVIKGRIGSYSNSLSKAIDKLRNLRSLTIGCNLSDISFESLANHSHLYELHLCGPIKERLPELPPNLTKLTLLCSRLQEDDVAKLESLSQLRILKLKGKWNSSEKWKCSSGAFSQLECLNVDVTFLKEWKAEKTEMPCLKRVPFTDRINRDDKSFIYVTKRVRELFEKKQHKG